MTFNFTKYSLVYYIISGILIIAAVVCLFMFGLKFGIEFAGGSNMEIAFQEQRPTNEQIKDALKDFDLGEITVQPTGSAGAILKFKGIDEATHQKILAKLTESFKAKEEGFQYIGPSVGQELRNKTEIAIVMALLAITIYIAFAFRKVSRPVSSWKYGVASLIALFHDILIPLGVFSFLGRFYGIQFTIPMVTALLTILGYTINDKVIIFDRVRENLLKSHQEHFEDLINQSLNQILLRSLSTGTCTLLVLFSIFFFGGETLKYFALTLIIGIVVGTYSSIFLAAPFLTRFSKNA